MTPDQAYCEKCRTVSLLTDRGACVWCLHQVIPRVRKKPKKPGAPPVLMPPELIDDALAQYEEGRSLVGIAREFLPRTKYANTRTMAQALKRQFVKRGVRIRGHVEQSVIQSKRQALVAQRSEKAARARLERIVAGLPERGPCSARTASGEPCRLPAEIGEDVCHIHDPANRARVAKHAQAMREARSTYFREHVA